MKSSQIFSLFFVSVLLSFNALAEVSSRCDQTAEKAVGSFAQDQKYDSTDAYDCHLAINRKVVICQVNASKGDGAANDSYEVVLNPTCSRALRIELTGEE